MGTIWLNLLTIAPTDVYQRRNLALAPKIWTISIYIQFLTPFLVNYTCNISHYYAAPKVVKGVAREIGRWYVTELYPDKRTFLPRMFPCSPHLMNRSQKLLILHPFYSFLREFEFYARACAYRTSHEITKYIFWITRPTPILISCIRGLFWPFKNNYH